MTNQRGFTLIELLAVFVLTFVVGSLVFSILTQSLNNYEQSELRSQAQTDVNRLIFQIRNVHQSGSPYTIDQLNPSTIAITPEDDSVSPVQFNGEPFQYDMAVNGSNINGSKTMNPQDVSAYSITVTVRQPSNDRFNPIELESSISRLQPSGGDDSQ
ncbi:type II secretory pathway pseudopilin PulG [Alkalibacillus flavidus]|uniref:Type II secretory pathway pseudopilin PulG n=1 Tax=Alkalibacillus flavidus TaxID=546021 RepID=A0ABV2KU70_9BACI